MFIFYNRCFEGDDIKTQSPLKERNLEELAGDEVVVGVAVGVGQRRKQW